MRHLGREMNVKALWDVRGALVHQQSLESSLSEVLVRQQGAGESSGVEVLPRLSWRGGRG